MAKKEEPFELQNYRFLPPRLQGVVDGFISKLDDVTREFAIKRYVEGKTYGQIAEEMGYAERSLYPYRERIITLWYLYSDRERLDYHIQRVMSMLQKHGVISHSRLLMNLSLKRSGLSYSEFTTIMDVLISSGKVVCYTVSPGKSGGRPAKKYSLASCLGINLADSAKETAKGGASHA